MTIERLIIIWNSFTFTFILNLLLLLFLFFFETLKWHTYFSSITDCDIWNLFSVQPIKNL